MEDYIVLIIGFLAAFLSALIGSFSGGGASLILLPILLIFAPGSFVSLLTVTKTSALVMTGVSGKIHSKRMRVDWRLIWTLIVSGLIGTGIGTYFVQYYFNEFLFKKLLAGVLLSTATYLFFSKKHGASDKKERSIDAESLVIVAFWTVLITIINGMFGGTGIFSTILLVIYFRMSFLKAVAYVMISYAVMNLFQVGYLLLTEIVDPVLLGFVVIGALIGGQMGTHLQYLKGSLWVRRSTITMMLIIGIKMLFG